MRYVSAAVAMAAATLTSPAALATGLDRSQQSVLPVFDAPGTLGVSLSYANPEVDGADIAGPGEYGDIVGDYVQPQISFTGGITDRLTFTVIGDRPFGADVRYDAPPQASGLGGTGTDLQSDAVTALLRYEVTPRVSVFGGVRAQNAGGTVNLNGLAYASALSAQAGAAQLAGAVRAAAADPSAPNQAAAQQILASLGEGAGTAFAGAATANPAADELSATLGAAGFGDALAAARGTVAALGGPDGAFIAQGGYAVDVDESWGAGLTLGAAYEIPEILLRLAVTYHSEVQHEGASVETAAFLPGGRFDGETSFETPQSVNVEFQSGVAEGTLVLGSVRWTDWPDFAVVPPGLNRDLADTRDEWRFNLGVARRFTPALVGLASVTYEPHLGDDNFSPLGPADGLVGLNVGGSYETGALTVSGGVNYTWLGDADTGVGGQDVARFEDNHAVGLGLRVAYEF